MHSSSLQSRFEKLLSSKRKKLKEAAKIYEYTRTVERGLQSAEIIQSASMKDDATRNKYLSDAGLMEVKRATVSVNKVKCVVSVLVPKDSNVNNGSALSSNTTDSLITNLKDDDKKQMEKEQRTLSSPPRFHPHEVVLCVTEAPSSRESTNILQMLRLITRPNQEIIYTIEEDRNGESSELRMQRTYLALAHQVLDAIRDYVSKDVEMVRNETDVVSQNDTVVSKNSTTVVGNSHSDSQFSLDSEENYNGASSFIIPLFVANIDHAHYDVNIACRSHSHGPKDTYCAQIRPYSGNRSLCGRRCGGPHCLDVRWGRVQ